jgi:nitrogen fixation/metabolism regulation signal transduction histidine kinase
MSMARAPEAELAPDERPTPERRFREWPSFGAFWAPLPPLLAAGLIGWLEPPRDTALLVLVASAIASVLLAARAERLLVRRLRTISSVLAAYRLADFSVRARVSRTDGVFGGVLLELNQLGDTLRKHRLGELEAWTLLRKVLSEIEVVVLAFDEAGRLKLANEAAERVLKKRQSELMGRPASVLGLSDLLSGSARRIVKHLPAVGSGPWELRRGSFRMAGEPHVLIVLPDVSNALREQEREAWKRLIVVMGHEINNSLAPIRSLSENLRSLLERVPRPDDSEQDLKDGLAIIARRAEGLGRFMSAYAKLARLPPPSLGRLDVGAWIRRVAALEQRLTVEVSDGPELSLLGDADQLDQLLINLVKNAADASLPSGGRVSVGWRLTDSELNVSVEDEGPGVCDTDNLFVPFFTTKAEGSGIGLVLARQIAEAHGGEVTLQSRPDRAGAAARIRLPIRA